jgi:PPOX class probable FMN-dependent enzyme
MVDSTPFVEYSVGRPLAKYSANIERVIEYMRHRGESASVDDAVDYALSLAGVDRDALVWSVRRSLRQDVKGRWIWTHDRRDFDTTYFADRVREFRALVDLAPHVRCPTLLIRGERGCPVEHANRFAAMLADARVVTIDGARHNVHHDQPMTFIKALRPFLDAHDPRPHPAPSATFQGVEELRAVYSPPAQRSLDKEIDRLDEHCRAFIRHTPFVVVATAAGNKTVDVSPKGGPPGFVAVLDDHHLAIGDMAGNNRLDSLTNIVQDGRVALLFMIPGTDETLRVNGGATITTDPSVLDRCPIAGLRPNVATVVEVRTAFVHCAKALRRAALWSPDDWPDTSDMASAACMLKDHIGLEGSVAESQRALDVAYTATTWKVGGDG